MNHDLECYTQDTEQRESEKGGERERDMCGGRVT